jgi:hypothetical protein
MRWNRETRETNPMSKITKRIEKTLLKKNQFLTSVSLTIGVDDDFLARSFPKAR